MRSPGPDIDGARLQRMGAFTNPEVASIIGQFLRTLDERIIAMTRAFITDDRERFNQLSHQLAGSAASCGFPALCGLCRASSQNPHVFEPEAFRSAADRARSAWSHELAKRMPLERKTPPPVQDLHRDGRTTPCHPDPRQSRRRN